MCTWENASGDAPSDNFGGVAQTFGVTKADLEWFAEQPGASIEFLFCFPPARPPPLVPKNDFDFICIIVS